MAAAAAVVAAVADTITRPCYILFIYCNIKKLYAIKDKNNNTTTFQGMRELIVSLFDITDPIICNTLYLIDKRYGNQYDNEISFRFFIEYRMTTTITTMSDPIIVEVYFPSHSFFRCFRLLPPLTAASAAAAAAGPVSRSRPRSSCQEENDKTTETMLKKPRLETKEETSVTTEEEEEEEEEKEKEKRNHLHKKKKKNLNDNKIKVK